MRHLVFVGALASVGCGGAGMDKTVVADATRHMSDSAEAAKALAATCGGQGDEAARKSACERVVTRLDDIKQTSDALKAKAEAK